MNVTIINIGDELLIGQVVNTNASTMSKLLTGAGMEVCKTMVVGDVYQDIRNAVDEAMHESDAVLVTGGLGPTKDISPFRTLKSCGSSSILHLRIHVPTGVIRGSFSIASTATPALSAFTIMLRNL